MTDSDARKERSPIGRFALLLLGVVAVLAGVRWLVTPDLDRRNFEYFPDMATSLALESQSLSSVFPDGLGEQALVAGVVPRGRLPFRFGKSEEESIRAGRELHSPLGEDDAGALTRGAEVYRIHCVPCHGVAGDGHGAAVMRGMLPPPPFTGASAMDMNDGRMFHVLTVGRGNMPAMAGRLDAGDRWRVISHVRALQRAPAEEAPEAPPPEEETK
jgi:mono/diheme cytochrome c family protein